MSAGAQRSEVIREIPLWVLETSEVRVLGAELCQSNTHSEPSLQDPAPCWPFDVCSQLHRAALTLRGSFCHGKFHDPRFICWTLRLSLPCSSVHPSIYLYIQPPMHPPIRPSVHLSLCLSIHESVQPSTHPSTYISTHPPVHCPSSLHPPFQLYIYPSCQPLTNHLSVSPTHLSLQRPVYPTIYPSIYLSSGTYTSHYTSSY